MTWFSNSGAILLRMAKNVIIIYNHIYIYIYTPYGSKTLPQKEFEVLNYTPNTFEQGTAGSIGTHSYIIYIYIYTYN